MGPYRKPLEDCAFKLTTPQIFEGLPIAFFARRPRRRQTTNTQDLRRASGRKQVSSSITLHEEGRTGWKDRAGTQHAVGETLRQGSGPEGERADHAKEQVPRLPAAAGLLRKDLSSG